MSIRFSDKMRHRKPISRFKSSNPELSEVIAGVRTENLTFLQPIALVGLAEAMLATESAGIDGEVVEAGAALGGSGIVLGRSKSADRPMRLYDTFGLIPPPSDKDGADVHERYGVITSGKSAGIGGGIYYGYHKNLIDEVRASFERHGVPADRNNVSFIQGVYEDTLNIDFPVALAHVDCDWYDSVKTCLDRIHPWIVSGGRFIIDDYYTWSGARSAVDEFLESHDAYSVGTRGTRLHMVKDA